MADTTQTVTNFSGNRRAIVTLWGISDGTGEDNATKVDINTMTVFDPVTNTDVAVSSLVVEDISWVVQGYDRIDLFWDTTEDNYIAVIPGGGRDTNSDQAGASEGSFHYGDVGLVDPSGAAGSILMTTVGNVAGDSYMIRLSLRLKT